MEYNNNEIFCEEEKYELTQNPTYNSNLSNCAYMIGSHYYNQQNYTYMKKYFQIATNLGNTKAMDNLFLYWYNIKKDFFMGVQKNHIKLMAYLGLYLIQKSILEECLNK